MDSFAFDADEAVQRNTPMSPKYTRAQTDRELGSLDANHNRPPLNVREAESEDVQVTLDRLSHVLAFLWGRSNRRKL
jgi:hypothetical protein